MASIACPTRQNRAGCPCDDNPLANLSSELTDGPDYIGFVPVPPIYLPQPGNLNEPGVPVICTSPVSQEEADQCAENGTVPPPYIPPQPDPENPLEPPQPPDTPPEDTGDINIPGPQNSPPPEPSGFWNTESNCIVFCPDNLTSATAIIPPHTILGSTQFEADMLSSNACIAAARSNLVCLTPPPEGSTVRGCANSPMSFICVLSGPVASINITGLPPGMTFNCDDQGSCTISGTPTTGGYYTVNFAGTTLQGSAFSIDFYIYVLEIICPTDLGGNGNTYSGTMSSTGGTGPYTWSEVGNNLSFSGLSLNANGTFTGQIAGGCTNINFTAQVIDSEGTTCTKDCTITVSNFCGCMDWGNPALTVLGDTSYNGGTTAYNRGGVAASCNGQNFGCACPDPAHPSGPCCASAANVELEAAVQGTLGVQCQCHIHIEVVRTGTLPNPNLDVHASFSMSGITDLGGAPKVINQTFTTTTTFDDDFKVTAGVSPKIYDYSAHAGPATDPGSHPDVPAGGISMTIQITNTTQF